MASSGAHLSREFFELVKSIGESKSKQEEDRIIQREVITLKKLFATGKHKPRKRVEMLVRLLYVEMLGHDASFGYIHAVQMTAGANLLHKKTAYLVSGKTLHPDHELRFMMVNVSKKKIRLDSTKTTSLCCSWCRAMYCLLRVSAKKPPFSGCVCAIVFHRAVAPFPIYI